MPFFYQLRLLLWKNYTLKKRRPLILCIELLVPIALFLILVAIRIHRQPEENKGDHWHPNALPSAGIIPLLQSFCKGGHSFGNHGYKYYPNASINQVLGDIADISDTPVMSAIIDLKDLNDDFQQFNNDPYLSKNNRLVKDFTISELLKNKTEFESFLHKNLSMPVNMINNLMNMSVNGSEVSLYLLERNRDLFEGMRQNITAKENLRRLQKSVVLQALFDPSSLTTLVSPSWMRLMAALAGIPGLSTNATDWQLISSFFQPQFLSAENIHELTCGSDGNFYELLHASQNSTLNSTHEIKDFLCALNKTEDIELSNELKSSINWTKVQEKFRLDGPRMLDYNKRATKIREDLLKLRNLQDAFSKLSKLSNDLQLNLSSIASRVNQSRLHQTRENINELWYAISPMMCGTPRQFEAKKGKGSERDAPTPLLGGSGESTHALKVMLYVMVHDPMILYSPNGTDADKVISKASRLLKLMKGSKELAEEWLGMSADFQMTISMQETQGNLKKILRSIDKFPFMYESQFKIEFFKWTQTDLIKYLIKHDNKQYMNSTKDHLRQVVEAMITNEDGDSLVLKQMRLVDIMAKGWISLMAPMKLDLFYGFPNETAMMQFIYNATSHRRKPILSAIVFDNIEPDGRLPRHLHYRIRMNGLELPSTQKVRTPYWVPGARVGHSNYFYYGFTWVQDQLERAVIEVQTNKTVTEPGIYVQEMPYPCYLEDNFMFVLQYIMPLCVVVSFIYTVAILTQSIVYEKEHRLKEVMKMMGLSNAVHWTSWFITSVCIMMVIVILMTCVLKYGEILKYSNTSIVFLFLTLAAIATTNFCFLMSIFFSKAKIAAACGGIIYFVTYMPYVFISIQEGGAHPHKISASYKTFASLFSTTALGLGARYFALFEQNGVGVQWKNLYSSPADDDTFNMARVFYMFIVDTVIYAMLVWYIETVFPGMYGIPRPWYFPFQPTYWFGPNARLPQPDCFSRYSRVQSNRGANNGEPANTPALLAMEKEPQHLKLGVFVDNLVKCYTKGTSPAVDNLSLNLYEGQITSFLGHNGAGKTTTMSLLTGLFPPTAGTASIYGHDIKTDMDKIRTSLGMCPQHNVLYEQMTVEEHLWFFARLKGMPQKYVKEETKRILEDIDMPEKRHSKVNSLSGGMKRKLSVAMAFVGGSKTVILDEPTAGVDPYARRAIWDLLEKYKDGRTILLSTHFMDEADILGDRIAIISHGKLRCCGSSLYLKTKFGDGYHLNLVKEKPSESGIKIGLSANEMTRLIQGYIPSAQLICETQYELSYILPDKDKDKKGQLKELIAHLEKTKDRIGCESFGLQDTTLEEVFLKVTEAQISGEEDMVNDLTTKVELSTVNEPTNSLTKEGSSIVESNNLSTLPPSKGEIKKRKQHKRSFSTDLPAPKMTKVCAHRRTPSGGYCGHRRALSSDLTFLLRKDEKEEPTVVPVTPPSPTTQVGQPICDQWRQGTYTQNKNFVRVCQQVYGLLLKRLHHTRRNLIGLLTNILLPSIFVTIAMSVALAQPKIDSYPPLVLSPSMYHPPPFYIPFSNSRQGNTAFAFKMEDTLKMASGIGADCVLKDAGVSTHGVNIEYLQKNAMNYFGSSCQAKLDKKFKNVKQAYQKTIGKRPTCKCKNSLFFCDKGFEGTPEIFTTVSQDIMLNISDQRFQTYLLDTNYKFRRHRYGGLTFGDLHTVVPEKVEQSKYPSIQRLFARQSARVWFSNKGFHAMPTFINALSNAILRASVTPEMGNPAAYGITAVTHPLNFTANALNLDSIKQGTDAIIAIFVIIAMSFVPASFIVFLVMERTTQSKHIQYVSGLNPVLYWLSNYLWDMLTFMIPAMVCMIIFHIFNVPAYASRANFPAVCALFICYGWSVTPMMYPASFLFREASTAYVVLIILNLFLGITCTVTTSILHLFPNDPQLKFVFDVVKIVFLIFPNYCLGRGLMDLAYNEIMNIFSEETGQFDKIRSPFEWDIVTRSLTCMIIEGFIFFLITLYIEYRTTVKRGKTQELEKYNEKDDEDVKAERQRVLSGADRDLLKINNLTKVYRSHLGKQMAVNRLCVGVGRGECFGLLGVNGAGKTTTFKMLTGDLNITSGDASIENVSVVRDLLNVHSRIGYCPQFDALFDHLTAEEHLYFYARLKAIPENRIKEVVSFLIKKMALTRYAKKPSKTYSGGNKRKLSAAIALMGNPCLIFMDEPTTGMDPGARRFLWNVILSIIQEGKRSVILTSHSMEECEALCTRLAIMVNGKFQCLGSTQHIKNRFGDGYIVVIRVKGNLPNMTLIKDFMKENFEDSILKECHHNVVQYQIPSTRQMTLSEIFTKVEAVCDELQIEDYSVSQTSLDNVFVNFAKYQRDSKPQKAQERASRCKKMRLQWQQMMERRRSCSKRDPVSFSELVQLPVQMDEVGRIGENEEEIMLQPSETARLTFEIA